MSEGARQEGSTEALVTQGPEGVGETETNDYGHQKPNFAGRVSIGSSRVCLHRILSCCHLGRFAEVRR